MIWQEKEFGELSARELFAIYRIRVAVFVVEQRCAYQEVDDKDLQAVHLFAGQDGEIAAYCRVIPEADGAHIGRVIVSAGHRGQGLAGELMRRSLAVCARRWPGQAVWVQAQAYLRRFYESLGFVSVSEVYLEDGIPHLDMRRGDEAT